jgi:hypothetical protein
MAGGSQRPVWIFGVNKRQGLRGRIDDARTILSAAWLPLLLLLLLAAPPLSAREKNKIAYGEGLTINVPFPEFEVEQVVKDVADSGIIRGTKEYNRDEYVSGAKAANTCQVFPAWTGEGKVFYKVREQALDPRNFKDSGDQGTLAVRYVVKAQGDKSTVLRIDAAFQEDFRRTIHASNGSVEGSEYKDILEHLEAIELIKKETAEAQKAQQKQWAKKQSPDQRDDALPEQEPESTSTATRVDLDNPAQNAEPSSPMSSSSTSASTPPSSTSSYSTSTDPAPPAQAPPTQSLEDRVKDLRKQVERLVKSPGAPLKSAPFHTAATLQTLPTGTEVLILISTPYWYGIETHEGQHGWIMRDELELP